MLVRRRRLRRAVPPLPGWWGFHSPLPDVVNGILAFALIGAAIWILSSRGEAGPLLSTSVAARQREVVALGLIPLCTAFGFLFGLLHGTTRAREARRLVATILRRLQTDNASLVLAVSTVVDAAQERGRILQEVRDAVRPVFALTAGKGQRAGDRESLAEQDKLQSAAIAVAQRLRPVLSRSPRVWIEAQRPVPPLLVEETYALKLQIAGVWQRPQLGASMSWFREADFGEGPDLPLLIDFFGQDFAIEPRQRSLTLPRTGNTETITTHVTPRRAGDCELRIVLSLALDLRVLQTLTFCIEVLESHHPRLG